MTADPQPPSDPWLDRPLTAQEMRALRDRLTKMTQGELVRAYHAALHMCRLDHGAPPRAAFIQQLVGSWKEMQRRRKVDPK
jgi:hypothetical protein